MCNLWVVIIVSSIKFHFTGIVLTCLSHILEFYLVYGWMLIIVWRMQTRESYIFVFILYIYWRALKVVLIRYVSSLPCPRNKRNLPQLFPFHWTEEGFLLPEIKILYRKFCILSSLRKFSDSRNLELEIDELSKSERKESRLAESKKKEKVSKFT